MLARWNGVMERNAVAPTISGATVAMKQYFER